MPRYKDSPEVRAAKKERKDKLREFLSLLEVDDMRDLRSLFKEMVGEVLENGLEAELDDELGYSKYDYRNKNTKNSRNGYSIMWRQKRCLLRRSCSKTVLKNKEPRRLKRVASVPCLW